MPFRPALKRLPSPLDNALLPEVAQCRGGEAEQPAEDLLGMGAERRAQPVDAARRRREVGTTFAHGDFADPLVLDDGDVAARLVLRVREDSRRCLDGTARHLRLVADGEHFVARHRRVHAATKASTSSRAASRSL